MSGAVELCRGDFIDWPGRHRQGTARSSNGRSRQRYCGRERVSRTHDVTASEEKRAVTESLTRCVQQAVLEQLLTALPHGIGLAADASLESRAERYM